VERTYLVTVRVLSAALLVVGLVMIVVAVAGGGGALAVGVLLGTLLAGLGAGRLYLSRPRAANRREAGDDTRGRTG
jgi:hypothetical protein